MDPSDRGLLWIKGKPGSGKSTLVKYAKDALPPIYGKETLVFSFFFHGRGRELQKTPIGLFQCLLHQLLKRVPGAVHEVNEELGYCAKDKGTGNSRGTCSGLSIFSPPHLKAEAE